MGLVLEEASVARRLGARCPIIRIIDDSFPAYDRERLIGRNGVKSRASFCHRRPEEEEEDRSFLATTLPSILARARFQRRKKYSCRPPPLTVPWIISSRVGNIIRAASFVTASNECLPLLLVGRESSRVYDYGMHKRRG